MRFKVKYDRTLKDVFALAVVDSLMGPLPGTGKWRRRLGYAWAMATGAAAVLAVQATLRLAEEGSAAAWPPAGTPHEKTIAALRAQDEKMLGALGYEKIVPTGIGTCAVKDEEGYTDTRLKPDSTGNDLAYVVSTGRWYGLDLKACIQHEKNGRGYNLVGPSP